MADYRPLLIRAISRLDSNTPAARQGVYTNARAALVALLNGQTSEEAFERERRALEDAIGKVEFNSIVGKPRPARQSIAHFQDVRNGSAVDDLAHQTEAGIIQTHSDLASVIEGEGTFDFGCLDRPAEPRERGCKEVDTLSKK
jgi:hypothetical protein